LKDPDFGLPPFGELCEWAMEDGVSMPNAGVGETERCQCGSRNIVESDDHYDTCVDCGRSWVG
jgi:hypothetical protein